jgi:hypothetical protein
MLDPQVQREANKSVNGQESTNVRRGIARPAIIWSVCSTTATYWLEPGMELTTKPFNRDAFATTVGKMIDSAAAA